MRAAGWLIGLGDVQLSIQGSDRDLAALINALSAHHGDGVKDNGENWFTLICMLLVGLCQLLR